MRAAVYFVLLVFCHASLCAQTAAPNISRLPGSQKRSGVKRGGSFGGEPRQDTLLRKAEAAFQRAASLRGKQTAKDLTVAAGLFRASAGLFVAASSYEHAADAYLQAGDIYSSLSQYGKAR